jgi:hypothetical protein
VIGGATPQVRYIVGPAYDWAFFLLPPLVALVLGIAIAGTSITEHAFVVNGEATTAAGVFVGALIHAHLIAVFVRSHGNRAIFARHRVRFLVVPVLLWLALVASPELAVTATVIATFWDAWHSGAQTFGLGRIYDQRHGNSPELGRRLDYWLNQLLYLGPILGGVSLLDHLDSLESYESVGAMVLASVPAQTIGYQRWLTYALLVGGAIFLVTYVLAYARLAGLGYRASLPKVFLYVTTGACSIYTWGFNSFGEAFFIMNFFHAVQYLALVWTSEQRTMTRLLRLERRSWGRMATLVVYLGAVATYGLFADLVDADVTSLWALTMVVSLMHFWYDGFIWSVRRREV